jgi:hypothetical protein
MTRLKQNDEENVMPVSKRKSTVSQANSIESQPLTEKPRSITSRLYPTLVLVSLVLGLLSGYTVSARETQGAAPPVANSNSGIDTTAMMKEVNPPDGYKLPVQYGDLGPRLIESGVINYDPFAAVYQSAGDSLTQTQIGILKRGSNEQIIITPQNAHFLLNFF